MVSQVLEKNSQLTLRGLANLRKKGLNVSYETIRRRLLACEVKSRSTIKKPLLNKKHIKKDSLGRMKI